MGDRRLQRDVAIRRAIESSRSIAEVLRKLGVMPVGGNYATIHRAIKRLQLDASHFTGQGHRRGSKIPVVASQPLERVLVRGTIVKSHGLRLRLIREGVMSARCSNCMRTRWLGGDIPLELDHKDGDRFNNELTNLRLLCPNCHALTPTYRGRNKRRLRQSRNITTEPG